MQAGQDSVSSVTFASFLRGLRTAQNLSLGKLAGSAGLSKGTVSEWESGAHRPRLPEINALLGALGATENQRERALLLLDAPRGHRGLREDQPKLARLEKEVGTMPGPGELLRALRLRRGLNLEPLAAALRISAATLSRWERGQVMPSPSQWGAALTALGATAEERAALRELQRERLPHFEHPTVENVRQRLQLLPIGPSVVANELSYLALEALAWPLASRSDSGRELLGTLFASHADNLSYQSRFKEARVYAERALMLLPGYEKARGLNWFSAYLASVHALVHGGRRPNPRPGLAMLQQGDTLPLTAHDRGWMYSRVAEYLFLDGATDAALSVAAKGTRLAGQEGPTPNYHWRQLDLVSLLRKTGRSADALQRIDPDESTDPAMQARLLECRVKVLVDLQQRSEAHEAMRHLRRHIDIYDLTDARMSAEKTALQL